jgi:Relaxase/Mobilisation nuclease domain
MNGRVFLNGKTFPEACQYVLEQSQAQVIYAEGVRTHDHRLMAEDFEWQHRLMPEKEKSVFHGVLSFPPGESVTDERLVEIGKKFKQKIEMDDTQCVFVKHTDKAHLHVHILANKVNNDGEPTGKGLIIERSMKAARELTEEYGLRQSHGKHLELTSLDALHEPDVKRYRIFQAIREQLPGCRGLDDLEARLLKKGITVRYREDGESGKRLGISFRLENRSFKGSRVDATYSLKGLERTLTIQQRQDEAQRLRRPTTELLSKGEEVKQEEQKQTPAQQRSIAQEEELRPVREEEEERQELVQRQGLRMRF